MSTTVTHYEFQPLPESHHERLVIDRPSAFIVQPIRPADCIHLSEVLSQNAPNGAWTHCGDHWLRACDLFGECRLASDWDGPNCQKCDRYHSLSWPSLEQAAASSPAWVHSPEAPNQFRSRFHEVLLDPLPNYSGSGRGVIICAGGWRFICGLFVTVRMLRWLGCMLPVEAWHCGPHEYDETFPGVCEGLGIRW